METKQATVMAGLASGRPLHNNAKAKFPPFPQKGVLWGERPDRGMFPVSGPSHLARSGVADHWRQADHYVTRPKRSSRLFPYRSFMGRASRQGVFSQHPVHRIWRVLWWPTIGVRPVITQLRTGEVPAYFPEGSFIWQATR